MEAKTTDIINLLSAADKFEIPIFQRSFCWEEIHWEQLFSDIESMLRNKRISSHFYGIFILKPDKHNFTYFTLIDGQQRLIAISLFIAALCDIFDAKQYKNALIISLQGKKKLPKINFGLPDFNAYLSVLFDKKFAQIDNSIFGQAYRYFYAQISNEKYELEDYFLILRKFEVVKIILSNKDNSQLIFDSLNSTGKTLTLFERTKNYILMGMPPSQQSNIYKNYWTLLEDSFSKDDKLFEKFMCSYLSMSTLDNIEVKNISNEFNKFYNYKRNYKTAEEIVAEFLKFSQYFLRIRKADFMPDLANEIRQINSLGAEEAYPFLLEIVDDFENKLITQEVFHDILDNTLKYIISRQAAKEVVIDFRKLSKNISKMIAKPI